MQNPPISFFFPAFNEEGNIESVVTKTVSVLSGITDTYEVIVVNDGSADETGNIAERLAKENDHVTVVHHPVNRGYGAALRTGYKTARYDFIFFADSDGQFDVSETSKFLPSINDFDIVTGFRLKRQDPFIRSINAKGWNVINRLLFGIKLIDINCAFKCVKRSVFNTITLTTDGAMINAELYAKARQHNLSIKEIGVHHYPRQAGTQTGANLSVIIKAFKELLRIKREMS